MNGPGLRTLREQAGLSRSHLAHRVGCTEGYIRNLENWGDQPSLPLTYRIVRELTAALGRAVTLDDVSVESDTEDTEDAA